MALTNEVLVGRYNGILTKLLSMKEGAPSPVLMPEIMPALVLENDRPEWGFLGGTQLGIGSADVGAVAAQFAHSEIRNPDNSGVISVIESVMVGGDVSLPFVIGLRRAAALALGATNFSTSRDSRQGILQITTQVFGGTLAVPDGGREIVQGGVLGRTDRLIPLMYVLAPGDALIARCGDANVEFKVNWRWYERRLDPAETR